MTIPVDACDREHELLCRLVAARVPGPEFDPECHVLDLLRVLGRLSCTLNAPDAGPDRWADASPELLKVIDVAVDLAAYYHLPPNGGVAWPDGTRIGGDGAYEATHGPHHLLAEVVEAAGWVAEWAPARHDSPAGAARSWLDAEPVTELVARTWCLADRLNLRDTLRAALARTAEATNAGSGLSAGRP